MSFPVLVWIVAIIVLAGGLTLIGLIRLLSAGDEIQNRLSNYAVAPDEPSQRDTGRRRARLFRLRARMNTTMSMFVSAKLGLQLLSANWPITETEFILIRLGATLVGFFIGWLLLGSLISGAGLALLAYIIPGVSLNRSIYQRQILFQKQLPDVLVLLSGALRSGYSLQQALELVTRETRPPASEEFIRVGREVSLGLPLNQALINLTDRMHNDDLYLVVTAININSKVGGNMVVMLEAVTKTIRERIRLFGELRALTSQQRFNSYILTLLPIGFGALMFVLNPKYISRLFEPGIWLCIPIGALVTTILGNIVIQKLVKIDV